MAPHVLGVDAASCMCSVHASLALRRHQPKQQSRGARELERLLAEYRAEQQRVESAAAALLDLRDRCLHLAHTQGREDLVEGMQ